MFRSFVILAAFCFAIHSTFAAEETLQKFVYEKAEMGLPFRISM